MVVLVMQEASSGAGPDASRAAARAAHANWRVGWDVRDYTESPNRRAALRKLIFSRSSCGISMDSSTAMVERM